MVRGLCTHCKCFGQGILKKIINFEGNTDATFIVSTKESISETTTKFQNFKGGALLDATFGFSRIGPSLGFRYVLNSDKAFNYFQFYGIWKF